MDINLDTEIQYLKGVGPKIAPKLQKLGIFTVSDLIYHYPRRYDDYTNISKIADIENHKLQITNYKQNLNSKFQNDQNVTIRAKIVSIGNKRTRRRGFTVTEAVVDDGSGSIKVVWFNQPYLAKMLRVGSEVILNGKIGFDPFAKTLQMESPNRANKPRIVPVYPETAGVSSYFIARLVESIKYLVSSEATRFAESRRGRGGKVESIAEYLPEAIVDKYQLLNIQKALTNLHEPENAEMLGRARRRIAFDEFFMIALRSQLVKCEIEKENAPRLEVPDQELKKFAKSLPFELTIDQKKASWEIIQDIGKNVPMNRLLNGDVGSGKTAVAVFAAYVAVRAGYRVVFMAPTEILAKQHFATLQSLLEKSGISIGMLTSNTKKSESLEQLNKQIIIGTQALIQKDVEIENLGLVVVDEQHRFGVGQRGELLKPKGKIRPHFLSMTATPIPRSLHLALFGDLDLSIIKSMPKGRKPIKTRFVDGQNRSKAYEFIRNQIKAGRQAFVICPLIEETSNSHPDTPTGGEGSRDSSVAGSFRMTPQTLFDEDRKSVTAEYNKLSKEIFPDLKIGMLHGRMKSTEKDTVMAEFKSGELDILVSTSVVEVGVDIPNAAIMMIEDAERFGLAQLHQFRGRVGRAEHQSFCFVFSSSRNPKAIERLKSFENILDGFKLAEIDLKNRGAGDMFGTIQSGYNELRMASYSDIELIDEASEAAKSIAPDVDKYPLIKDRIGELMEHKHLE